MEVFAYIIIGILIIVPTVAAFTDWGHPQAGDHDEVNPTVWWW